MSTTQTAHTPGPWTVDLCRITKDAPVDGFAIRAGRKKHSIASVNVYEHATAVIHEDYQGVVDMDEHYTREELAANAALIASAPDLLAACKAALPAIQWATRHTNTGKMRFQEVIDQLRAAIEAGEGR